MSTAFASCADLIPLRFLAAGQCARVGSVIGRPEDVHRLEEIGLRRGELIEMLQPGTPCIIRFRGGKFCVRNDEALGVLVSMGDLE